jgi:3-oxoacyl-(acyl-carrier-protein) synthase
LYKIAITGLGVVSPAGQGKVEFWQNIQTGQSFMSPITRFDAAAYPSQIAGQIEELAAKHISPRLLKKLDRFSVLALAASEDALQDAGLDLTQHDPYISGVFLGNALGGWLYAETELRDLYVEGRDGVSPYNASAWFPAAPQGQVSIRYRIKGYSKTVVADKASALIAIDHAARIVDRGKLTFALAGGTEAPVTPYAMLCCSTEGGLSPGPYRPFDKERNGFVVGEGAAVVVLETADTARQRGAEIYGFVTGFGTTCDGTHRILPDVGGEGLAQAIRFALATAKYNPEDIDYICADGVATELGDISEARAIRTVFGDRADQVPVSAPKSMYGHLLGAAGAVELVGTVMAMQGGMIPPTINHRFHDPECNLDLVLDEGRRADIGKALVIARGRGGVNAVMAVERS